MISQQKVEALCQQLEAMYIPGGPRHTEHGARNYVRSWIVELLRNEQLGGYERITHLVRSVGRDCTAQAVNEKEAPELRAEYAQLAKAWDEFDPMVQSLWYHH